MTYKSKFNRSRWMRTWRIKNPELAKAAWRKSAWKRYGLTPKLYNSILGNQSGVCAICGKENTGGKILVVDHNHITGEVRGLLCDKCNWYIGFLERVPLVSLKQYLEIV